MSKNKNIDNLPPETNSQDVLQAAGALEKFTPKYCTAIQVGLLSNRNIILTMLYSETGQQASVIERVVIDADHAKKLAEVLTQALERVSGEDLV